MDNFLSLMAPRSDASGGGAIFSLPWGASDDSASIRDAEFKRGSAKDSVASSKSHGSHRSSFSPERSGQASGMGEAAGHESARGGGMMSARIEASTSGPAPADAPRNNGTGHGIRPQEDIGHQDLKRRIEENLELLQRHVHEARQEKDGLLDEVELVLQQYKDVALLNKDAAVQNMDEEDHSSGRVSELRYKVKQQERNLLVIERDIKNVDSALLTTHKLKNVSYMTGMSAGMGPRMAQRREELLKNQRQDVICGILYCIDKGMVSDQASEELAKLNAELRSIEPARWEHTKMHHSFKLKETA